MIKAAKQLMEDKLFVHGAYVRLFESPDGKLVLKHLVRTGFIMTSTFVAGDPHQTALNEGSRRMVLSILRHINKTPQDVIQEIEESYKL